MGNGLRVRRSDAMQEKIIEKAWRHNIKTEIAHFPSRLIGLNCVMLIALILKGCNTELTHDIEALAACLLNVVKKKGTNSLHDLVDTSLGATDTGGFVSLSTAVGQAH